MQISTASFYDRAASRMSDLTGKVNRLQTEISSKKLTVASQNASDWTRLGNIRQGTADDAAAKANVTLARGLLAQTDGALAGTTDQLIRARELTVQANGGPLSPQAREAIAVQLDGIREDLLSLANSRDVRGQPIFGGTGDAAFVSDAGGVRYVGDDRTATIPIGEGTGVQVGADGARVFGGADGTTDIFATLSTLAGALRTPGADLPAAAASALTGLDAVEGQVINARASAGARAARLEIESARIDTVGIDREEARLAIEETDLPTAMVELQKTMTVLQATQASVAKLAGLSLFDYLK